MNHTHCDLSIVHESYLHPSEGVVSVNNKIIKYEYELFFNRVFHFNFFGEISPTGYRSYFFFNNEHLKEKNVEDFAILIIAELLDEFAKSSIKELSEEKNQKIINLKKAQLSLF